MADVNIKEVEGGEVTTLGDNDGLEIDTGTVSNWIKVTNLVQAILKRIAGLTEKTSLVDADKFAISDSAASDAAKYITRANVITNVQKGLTQRIRGTVANPNGYYNNIRAQIPLFRADAALTITRIHIHGADLTPTSELAGDLKFADDLNTGGFANAAVIDVCDTTSGVFTATSAFDDATVPSGKYVYFQMDAAPHTDWKDFFIEVYYTYD